MRLGRCLGRLFASRCDLSLALFASAVRAAEACSAQAFYEKGGIDRPSRSALLVPIALPDQERDDLDAFMEALTGVEGNTKPFR